MEWSNNEFLVSTEKHRLDIDVINEFLANSYWASGRTREQIERTIENSICFGLFYGDRQIGFARLVTDEVAISWLGDVFVISDFQNRGLGKWLIECVTSHPTVKRTKCFLGTKDAHGLYEKYGWERKELMARPDENRNREGR